MSVRQMTKVWDLNLPHSKQSVMLALADHADDDGDNVYPSVARICWKTGYEERQIRKLLAELRDWDNLIELVEKGGGRGKPSRYRLTLQNGVQKTPFKEWLAERKKVQSGAGKPCTDEAKPCTEPEETLHHSPPEPSVHENRQVVEPSEKPSVSTEGTQSVSLKEVSEDKDEGNRTPQQQLADRLYEKLYEQYDIKLSPQQFGFHIKHFGRILEENATEAECERVLAHMVTVWPKAPKVEAFRALQDVRLGRDDGSAFEKPQEPGYYAAKEQSADKPYPARWYATFYGGRGADYQPLIEEGLTHTQVLERITGEVISGAA